MGVHYEELAPMLLNEMRHERKAMTLRLGSLTSRAEKQEAEIQELKREQQVVQNQLAKLSQLNEELLAGHYAPPPKEEVIAQR